MNFVFSPSYKYDSLEGILFSFVYSFEPAHSGCHSYKRNPYTFDTLVTGMSLPVLAPSRKAKHEQKRSEHTSKECDPDDDGKRKLGA